MHTLQRRIEQLDLRLVRIRSSQSALQLDLEVLRTLRAQSFTREKGSIQRKKTGGRW